MITRNIRTAACCGGAIGVLMLASNSWAQQRSFDIPKQSATKAIPEFALQSGLQIVAPGAELRNITTNGVRGGIDARLALKQLIEGTGLAVDHDDGQVITLGRIASAPNALAEPGLGQVQNEMPSNVTELVVTGSRIRRAETTTPAPVNVIDAQVLTERGFVQVGQALNQMTSVAPFTPVTIGTGVAIGNGQQFPNLFNLGAGRTLSLVNGRRTVTTSSGLGDRVVDTNSIPTGLIERIDVVQAGGAAVYGSDAIAGVINYVLKKDYQGLEVDAQYGLSSRGDYPQTNFRVTAGRNFQEGRGNVAVNLEYSKTRPLYYNDRPATAVRNATVPNTANTSTTDGLPPSVYVSNVRNPLYNFNGVVFTTQSASNLTPALRSNGSLVQFGPGGSLVLYNPGVATSSGTTAIGGDGYDPNDSASLFLGIARYAVSGIGHYNLTDRIKLSGEATFTRTVARDPGAPGQPNIVIGSTSIGSIPFTRANAFLNADTLAQLSAASPAFASGGPLFISKIWGDLLPTREVRTTTMTKQGLVALDGDFNVAKRNIYWSFSASIAEAEGETNAWGVLADQRDRAYNAVRNASGQIVCAVNADAVTTNDDPTCVPLNLFGPNSVTPDMRAYISAPQGTRYVNRQEDYLATIGGDIFPLPGGNAAFSLAYEHRREGAKFVPDFNVQRGLIGARTVTRATSGDYHTDELSGEVLLPLLGEDFSLPGIKYLEVNGQYRFVDNSIAGREKVWGAGLRWEVFSGLTLRASKSRNFRAPTLTQLFAPSRTAGGMGLTDPCDADRINSGPSPAVRLANCRAEWARNPTYPTLATFQDIAEGTSFTQITTGGNPNLQNEVSDTTTYGLVFQPRFVPGLTFVADVIDIDLTNGLSNFGVSNFLATCYDSSPQPADICATFTRNPDAVLATGAATTFNAGLVKYKGEVYNITYQLPLSDWFQRDIGRLELGVEATHNRFFTTSVTGFDLNRTDNTTSLPDWVARFDARYSRGPLRLNYTVNYRPSELTSRTASIENTPVPLVKSNTIHNVSAIYNFGSYTVRVGINNLMDKGPSFPTLNYGDILGRQWFMGLRARF